MASSVNRIIRVKPANIRNRIDESKFLKQFKKINPEERYVVLFPDSRNVFPGMGVNLMNCRPSELVYQEAGDLTNLNILKLCTQRDQSELTKTLQNEYLAAYVTSHATMVKFGFEKPHDYERCKGAGGIGIGLLNSLVFSGALSFADGLDLLLRYSQAMGKAANIVPNARLHVRIKPGTNRIKVCHAAMEHCLKVGIPEEVAICSIVSQMRSNYLVYGGHEEAIRFLEDEGYRLFDFWDMRRDRRTPYAYHSSLMQPAHEFIKGYIDDRLQKCHDYLQEPKSSSVYSTTSGHRLRTTKAIIRDLQDFPINGLLIETMLKRIYQRPKEISQPNSVVPWDRFLLQTLLKVNRKAWEKAKLLQA